jgi:carbonic anhydrase/acetyltransferase-like protein (isoleucine patch superfamily)
MINHFANIGNNVSIGTRSYVGAAAIISDNIQLPAGILIPDKARVLNPGDVNKYLSSTYLFNKQSSEIYSVLAD